MIAFLGEATFAFLDLNLFWYALIPIKREKTTNCIFPGTVVYVC